MWYSATKLFSWMLNFVPSAAALFPVFHILGKLKRCAGISPPVVWRRSARSAALLIISRIAGVEDISPHDLRHRFGYRMAETVYLCIVWHKLWDTILWIRQWFMFVGRVKTYKGMWSRLLGSEAWNVIIPKVRDKCGTILHVSRRVIRFCPSQTKLGLE